jgi:hypothetical protein
MDQTTGARTESDGLTMARNRVNGSAVPFVASTPWRERLAAAAVERLREIIGYLSPSEQPAALTRFGKSLGIDRAEIREIAALEEDFICRQLSAMPRQEHVQQERVDDPDDPGI